jgi:hypothetical protein
MEREALIQLNEAIASLNESGYVFLMKYIEEGELIFTEVYYLITFNKNGSRD